MHNRITMLVLFLEHHDKYCSRTIIETFEMSHFCKTRKKARKNMNMGEVILLTSKYDSPARQPKKNCNGYTLVPLVNALCLTYSVTTACSTCGHVVKRISRRSVDVDFEQQWLQGWLCACMILSQLFLMLQSNWFAILNNMCCYVIFSDICFLLLLNYKATTIECLPDTVAIPSSSLLKILNWYLSMFSLVTIPSATTGITAKTPGRKGKIIMLMEVAKKVKRESDRNKTRVNGWAFT